MLDVDQEIYKRENIVAEVAILVASFRDHDGIERAKEGDIITVRKRVHLVGRHDRESKIVLWLYLQGLHYEEMYLLKSRGWDSKSLWDDMVGKDNKDRFEKRRFSIPLKRLKQLCPRIDLNRVRDINDTYQPFAVIDEDNQHFLIPAKPFDVEGLVYDKVTGNYL